MNELDRLHQEHLDGISKVNQSDPPHAVFWFMPNGSLHGRIGLHTASFLATYGDVVQMRDAMIWANNFNALTFEILDHGNG